MIEKYEQIDEKILNYLMLKFDKLNRSELETNEIKLDKFAYFQEGPGIRNWQYVMQNGINFINIKCIQNNNILLKDANMISKDEAFGIYQHFLLKEKDIVVSTSGTLGRLAIVRKNHLPLCLNTSVIRFQPLKESNYPYLLCYLMSDNFKNLILSMASGSAQLNFGPTHLKKISLKLPENNQLISFNDNSMPFVNKHLELLDKIDLLYKVKELLLQKYFG